MTRINDYLWHLPHTPEAGDPPSVDILQQVFNTPIVALLREPLAALGYDLSSNDVLVRLDERVDRTADTYYANVRFIHYLRPNVITRVHFEHGDWADFLPGRGRHQYTINLDRFMLKDPASQIAVPGWEGRLHTRMSNRDDYVLEHSGEDQIWAFTSGEQFQRQLELFLDKFTRLGVPWLENLTGVPMDEGY